MADMLGNFRQKNPAYKDVPDAQLADGLYRKFYADKMPRDEFDAKIAPVASTEEDGISGPTSALKNVGQGFNRGLGRLVSGADYAMLGFLDDTPEGQAERPLGYLAQVLKGEQEIPGTAKRFAHDPTTRGEQILQRGGEVLGESIGPAAVMAAPARMLGTAARPATSAIEQGLKTLSDAQAGIIAPEVSALSRLGGRAAEAGTRKVLGDTVGGAVAKGAGAARNAAREARQIALLGGETAASIGSGIGEEIGREATPDSMVGPVVGGLVGGLAPAAAAMPMVRSGINKAADFAQNLVSPQASAKRARQFVADQIGPHLDGDAAQVRLQRAEQLRGEIEGFNPDLAQATGSEALKETKADIFKVASGGDLEKLRAREAANEQAIREFAARNAPEGQGGADAALDPLVREREAAAQQVRDLEQQKAELPALRRDQAFDARETAAQRLEGISDRERALPTARDITDIERSALEELTNRTNGARADIAGRLQRVDRSAEGAKVREGIKAERSKRMQDISQMSKEFGLDDVALDEPMANFMDNITQWRSSLLPSQRDNMPDVMEDVTELGNRARGTLENAANPDIETQPITFNDIKALRESVGDTVLESTRDTSPGHRKRLANAIELRRRIDEKLLNEDLIDSDGYRQFRRRYFDDIIEPFERGQVKKTTSKDGTGFFRTLDEEVALGFLDSADAAEQISRVSATQPDLMASLEAVALDDLASKAVASGVVNPRSLERWIESKRGALEHLPQLRKSVGDIASAVADVEGRFQQGKKIIRERKLGEQKRLADQRATLSNERKAVRQGTADQVRQITKQTADDQAQLDRAMDPLLERMGAHNERKMALEDTQLARRLAAVAGGGSTPTAVIDQAMQKPELMRQLWRGTEQFPDARKALQRHLWDGLTELDGASLRGYLESNVDSLRIAFGRKHLAKLATIADGLEMVEFAQMTGRAKGISTDLVTAMKKATGLNPQAMAGSYTGLSRGRSNKTVEVFNNLYRWMSEKSGQGTEKLLRTALFEPDVARGLIESAQFKTPQQGETAIEKFATKRLRGWLWRLGVVAPIEERERTAK